MKKTFSAEYYRTLRTRVHAQLPSGSCLVVPAAGNILRNGDVHFPFRQNSNYHYLTGITEEDGWLVINSQGEHFGFVLPKDPSKEQWDGLRLGSEQAKEVAGLDEAWDLNQVKQVLPGLLHHAEAIYCPELDKFKQWLTEQNIQTKAETKDATDALGISRLIKTPQEVELMQHSCNIAAQAHINAMLAVKPGMYEYELEAVFLSSFRKSGAEGPAYTSIVGSGNNGCILHYNSNDAQIHDGDLVLIDAGCEYGGYASDITRTFPANGKFSAEQADLYNIVLKAQDDVTAIMKPGTAYDALQATAARSITQGLVDVGILSGEVDGLVEQRAYFPFYMHRVGHWLGRDVHDVGRRGEDQGIKLQEGMIMTNEPGIYILNDLPQADSRWHGIGIRVEDDILITNGQPINLSAKVPSSLKEVEELSSQNQ